MQDQTLWFMIDQEGRSPPPWLLPTPPRQGKGGNKQENGQNGGKGRQGKGNHTITKPLSELFSIESPVLLTKTAHSASLRIETDDSAFSGTIHGVTLSELARKLNKGLWIDAQSEPASQRSSQSAEGSQQAAARDHQAQGAAAGEGEHNSQAQPPQPHDPSKWAKSGPAERPPDSRRPNDRFGPRQAPTVETVARPSVKVNEGGAEKNVPVNPSSQEREYSLDGYEDFVYIDPERKIDHGQVALRWRVIDCRHVLLGCRLVLTGVRQMLMRWPKLLQRYSSHYFIVR